MPSRRFVVKNEVALISCARGTRCTPPLTLISPQARRRPTQKNDESSPQRPRSFVKNEVDEISKRMFGSPKVGGYARREKSPRNGSRESVFAIVPAPHSESDFSPPARASLAPLMRGRPTLILRREQTRQKISANSGCRLVVLS